MEHTGWKERYCRNLHEKLFFDADRLGASYLEDRLNGFRMFPEDAAARGSADYGAILRFAMRLDSEELFDAAYRLRSNFQHISEQPFFGDARVITLLACEALYCLFPDTAGLYASLAVDFAKRYPALAGPEAYLAALITAQVAKKSGLRREALDWLDKAESICTDCIHVCNVREELAGGGAPAPSPQYDLSGRTCLLPFNMLMTLYSESSPREPYSFRFCDCPTMLPFDLDFTDPWNGPAAREIRSSIHDGSFRYCNRAQCYHVRHGTLPKRAEIPDEYIRMILDRRLTMLPRSPYKIALGHDMTCNLSCPSCRSAPYRADKTLQERHDHFFLSRVKPLLGPNVHWIHLGCTGEAFASPHILRSLASIPYADFPNLKFYVLSNGQLLNPALWQKLGEAAKCMTHISVSVDGATAKTYNRLRFPGTLENLSKNMAWLGSLKKTGDLKYLRVQCVVQADNMDELPELYTKCLQWHVDDLVFAPIRNRGTFQGDAFKRIAVGDTRHPLHEKLESTLSAIRKESQGKPITIHVG
jgi:hypothetical protein